MNGGVPPTAENARTGLLTPPGRIRFAWVKRRLEALMAGNDIMATYWTSVDQTSERDDR